jgi:hypothetical protein
MKSLAWCWLGVGFGYVGRARYGHDIRFPVEKNVN